MKRNSTFSQTPIEKISTNSKLQKALSHVVDSTAGNIEDKLNFLRSQHNIPIGVITIGRPISHHLWIENIPETEELNDTTQRYLKAISLLLNAIQDTMGSNGLGTLKPFDLSEIGVYFEINPNEPEGHKVELKKISDTDMGFFEE